MRHEVLIELRRRDRLGLVDEELLGGVGPAVIHDAVELIARQPGLGPRSRSRR
jgi:hypothetical protein